MRFALAFAVAFFAPAVAAAEPSSACLAAAHRMVAFVTEEAKGTRHEAQIAATVAAKGEGALVSQFAETIPPDQCAYLLVAPDSVLRAMAIASLPERNGK